MSKHIIAAALLAAYRRHDKLGEAGLQEVRQNQFGDMALRGDIEAEEAVIESLRDAGLGIRIISEEHGIIDMPTNGIRHLGFLDGIDGSSLYRKARGTGRYATMFVIFEGADPCYRDYLAAGIMEHANGCLFIATREKAEVRNNGLAAPLVVSHCEMLTTTTRFYTDNYTPADQRLTRKLAETFPYVTSDSGCSALCYTDLLVGKVDAVIETTRKNNLEIAAAYGLIDQAGGTIIIETGECLGDQNYMSFMNALQGEHLIIAAATSALAEHI